MQQRTIDRAACQGVGPDFLAFRLNPDTSWRAPVVDVANWFFEESGRTFVSAEGNNDTLVCRYTFTPELTEDEAEMWAKKLGTELA